MYFEFTFLKGWCLYEKRASRTVLATSDIVAGLKLDMKLNNRFLLFIMFQLK